MSKKHGFFVIWALCGFLLTAGTVYIPFLKALGIEALGPLLGIAFIVFSLFGDLPRWISWTQVVGSKLYVGIVIGMFALLIPMLFPGTHHDSSLVAWSPTVWAAYISIVLVGISFETSTIPGKIYAFFKGSHTKPHIIVPLYVIIAGLLGNILDGVSIVIISTIILMNLLSPKWLIRAMFALLFGGLISNLITVAAEPTNIKFQDSLGPLLDKIHPSFWITNWPICILGILFPAVILGVQMKRNKVIWKSQATSSLTIFQTINKKAAYIDGTLAGIAAGLLGAGIIAHAVLENVPLWLLLIPAGLAAINHLFVTRKLQGTIAHIKEQAPVWMKLMVIFSLLWFLQFGLTSHNEATNAFFLLPHSIQYFFLVLLALASAVTDNVALAAMQGSIIINHPLPIWEIRLLLILLTWAGGLTPFGCLQSLSINHRLKLSTGQWLSQTPLWAGLALLGGLIGLIFIGLLYH